MTFNILVGIRSIKSNYASLGVAIKDPYVVLWRNIDHYYQSNWSEEEANVFCDHLCYF